MGMGEGPVIAEIKRGERQRWVASSLVSLHRVEPAETCTTNGVVALCCRAQFLAQKDRLSLQIEKLRRQAQGEDFFGHNAAHDIGAAGNFDYGQAES